MQHRLTSLAMWDAALRHNDNNKWYGVAPEVSADKLWLPELFFCACYAGAEREVFRNAELWTRFRGLARAMNANRV